MVKGLKLTPVLAAAAGCAAGFYVLNPLFRSGPGMGAVFPVLFAPVAAICFFRSLAACRAGGFLAPDAAKNAGLRACPGRRFAGLANFYLAAFAAGLALGLGAGGTIPRGNSYGLPPESLRGLSGVLLEDPGPAAGGKVRAALSLRESLGAGGARVSARGSIPVYFPPEAGGRLREFGRGTLIFAEGRLAGYDRGRAETGKGGGDFFVSETLHVLKPAAAPERFRTGLRLGLAGRFTRARPPVSVFGKTLRAGEDWGGLSLALLLGIRDSLDSGLAGLYRDAGCSYVLALSGMHLAVLAALVSFLLKKPLGLKFSALAGALIISLYCLFVGSLPSLNRAVLMYLLGVLAILGALPREPLSLLSLSFLIQLVLSPRSGFSLSFILSYLALAGILIVGESLCDIFPGKIPEGLLKPLSASLGAFLVTAPVTVYFFGTLRPAGILAGLALVPLTTAFMTVSLAWLPLDLFSPFLSGLLSPLLSLLYGLMEKTVGLAARVPGLAEMPLVPVTLLSLGLSVFVVCLASVLRLKRSRMLSFA
ncbi:MAG: ComEC/Rec2 family competence protein [Treponema sp.]|jgi:competence protein ComEC|nr:ComEC/Rec2 family competence protein [Treponema sp.]